MTAIVFNYEARRWFVTQQEIIRKVICFNSVLYSVPIKILKVGIKSRVSHILRKRSCTELYPSPGLALPDAPVLWGGGKLQETKTISQ